MTYVYIAILTAIVYSYFAVDVVKQGRNSPKTFFGKCVFASVMGILAGVLWPLSTPVIVISLLVYVLRKVSLGDIFRYINKTKSKDDSDE